ncbi:MAG: LLM class F420-dependent oxidoreductase [Ilumatobacteraceae bacterium]
MRFGAVFPTTEIGDDPIAVRDYAQAAEALGCVRLTTYDHVLGVDHADRDPALRGPYTQHDPFHEPFVLFGFLAAHTTRIELATGVLILPQRQAALVAKQAAEVDLLSGGRLVLGVGTGWNHVEYAALGVPFADRARRFDDQVTVLRALWDDELVDHASAFHHIERAGLVPRPGRQIPLWMGGSADAALARAARIGDGHIFAGSTDRHFEGAARLLDLLAEQGRDRSTFGMDMFVDFADGPDVWHDRAQRWEELGGSLLSMRSMTTGTSFLGVAAADLAGPAEHIAALERFAKEMGLG